MLLNKSSLTVVLLGDWNKLYIQPNWIAENVYCKAEIEVGVIGQGTDITITYRSDNIIIAPSQSQVTFTAQDINATTIERLATCINNFLQKATTPMLTAYGFNCDFSESNSCIFADVVDSITDNSSIIENGYEILSTKITRSLSKDGIIINLETTQNGSNTVMHFNEHHGTPVKEMPEIKSEMIKSFVLAAKSLVRALGYDIEETD